MIQIKKDIVAATYGGYTVKLIEFEVGYDDHLMQRIFDDLREYGYYIKCDNRPYKQYCDYTGREEQYIRAIFSRNNII